MGEGGERFQENLFIFSVHFSFCSFAYIGHTSQCRSVVVVVVVVSNVFQLKIIGLNLVKKKKIRYFLKFCIIIIIIISMVQKARIDFCHFWAFLGEINVILETLTIIKMIKFFLYNVVTRDYFIPLP